MDDDVRELSRKCAGALGLKSQWHSYMECWRVATKAYPIDGEPYRPDSSDAQAFELLCWLAERGQIAINFSEELFKFWEKNDSIVVSLPCSTTAELRLALMRAVCKVKEG